MDPDGSGSAHWLLQLLLLMLLIINPFCAGIPGRADCVPTREEGLPAHGTQRDASLPD